MGRVYPKIQSSVREIKTRILHGFPPSKICKDQLYGDKIALLRAVQPLQSTLFPPLPLTLLSLHTNPLCPTLRALPPFACTPLCVCVCVSTLRLPHACAHPCFSLSISLF